MRSSCGRFWTRTASCLTVPFPSMSDPLRTALTAVTSCAARMQPVQELLRAHAGGDLPVTIQGLQGSFLAVVTALLRGAPGAVHDGSILVVTPTEQEADLVAADLRLFTGREVIELPWWGTLPYARQAPLPAVFGRRADALVRLASGDGCLAVAPLRALLTPTPERSHLLAHTIGFRTGQEVDPGETAETLAALGYLRVPRVSVHGEFSVKGEVIDVFPFALDAAVRVVLDFDQVTEIRHFDPLTQGSIGHSERVEIAPAREVTLHGDQLDRLREALPGEQLPEPFCEEMLDALQRDPQHTGVEQYYPLCFPEQHSVVELLGDGGTLVLADAERLRAGFQALRREVHELYRRAQRDGAFGPRPKSVLLDYARVAERHTRRITAASLQRADPAEQGRLSGAQALQAPDPEPRLSVPCDPPRSFFGNIPYFREQLAALVDSGYRVFVFAVYDFQAARIRGMVDPGDGAAGGVTILPHSISAGFSLPDCRVIFIQENEIFGRKRRLPQTVARGTQSAAIDSFVDLTPGDCVVHVNYGIGLYHGISRMTAAGNERDYMEVEYAGEERVYVPIEQVNLVQRYIGRDGIKPKLDKIGGRSWENRKQRVRKSVEEMAERLVRLYSRRRSQQGFAFPADTDWHDRFDAAFEYQETEDQVRCIEEVKADMEHTSPMDRLVCGDVGFGKTEVALRAAFKAVMGGKQVALLSPTTILAEQHYDTFSARFAPFPVQVEMLSRFRSKVEQKRVIEGLQAGQVDIVVGTHRLVQRDVSFKNLGMLIVDEEQRFGVKHKEWLKEVKTSVDCLTLTATPIPRTLHMSLAKIRDMSIINTAPQNRLPVETYIEEFDEVLAAEAIRKEVARGGQVFYLHNRVRTIREVLLYLQRLLPGVSFAHAHGQMDEDDLEQVMRRFIGHEVDVLVSTSIIENGLDIPNVNTIVIDRADMFGIAQLYQLRGRVGRSDRPAYAYLFYPRDRALTELAMKRLKVISDFTDLGSGFKVALKDMEVRGAGNLLGAEQSGEILAVGYDMYVRLLDDAIAAVRGDGEVEIPDVYLELEYAGFIPDDYVSEPMEKMEIYKKVAAVGDEHELARLHAEVEDRFGPAPDAVLSLLAIAEIRVACRRLAISSLKERSGVVTIEFARIGHVSAERVVRLMGESGGAVMLDKDRPNCLLLKTGGIDLREKSEFISEKLNALA